ncbi:MAG: CpaD family pilus assembly protein [Rhodospirillales bacterium]|nr:CpaD family pilus assembly protein [Rhodospirillales bacterium]
MITLIAVVTMVSACSPFVSGSKRAGEQQYRPLGQYELVVTESVRTLAVQFGEDESTLAPHVLAPMQVFADDFVDQGGGTLFIEVAPGQSGDMLPGKLSYLGAELRKRGIKANELVVRPAEGSRSAEITLAYTKYQASVPGCPDWSQTNAGFHRNVAHSNFGCSVRGNLAKMLANPRDLVEPREFSNADAHSASRAIGVYRSGEAEPVSTSSSEVGKDDK